MHVAALIAAALPALRPAAQTPAVIDRLLVANKAEATVSLLDPATRREVALVPVGDGPREIAVAPDGRTAVVCNHGGQEPGGSLTVIDVAAGRALRTFALRGGPAAGSASGRSCLRPCGVGFLPDGARVVVTCEQERHLLLVDLARGAVAAALPTGQETLRLVALAADGRTAFGTSSRDGSVGVFALAAAAGSPPPARVLRTGAGAGGIAVRPGSGEVFVANRDADTVSVADAAGTAVVAALRAAGGPVRVAFTPDGALALVSCAEAGEVLVFDAASRRLARTIVLGGDKSELSPMPDSLCVEPDGRRAWVVCQRGEYLALVDLGTCVMIDRIQARAGPEGLAFARSAARAAGGK